MSRTKRGSKPQGYEYWGKRGRKHKNHTHKAERQKNKYDPGEYVRVESLSVMK